MRRPPLAPADSLHAPDAGTRRCRVAPPRRSSRHPTARPLRTPGPLPPFPAAAPPVPPPLPGLATGALPRNAARKKRTAWKRPGRTRPPDRKDPDQHPTRVRTGSPLTRSGHAGTPRTKGTPKPPRPENRARGMCARRAAPAIPHPPSVFPLENPPRPAPPPSSNSGDPPQFNESRSRGNPAEGCGTAPFPAIYRSRGGPPAPARIASPPKGLPGPLRRSEGRRPPPCPFQRPPGTRLPAADIGPTAGPVAPLVPPRSLRGRRTAQGTPRSRIWKPGPEIRKTRPESGSPVRKSGRPVQNPEARSGNLEARSGIWKPRPESGSHPGLEHTRPGNKHTRPRVSHPSGPRNTPSHPDRNRAPSRIPRNGPPGPQRGQATRPCASVRLTGRRPGQNPRRPDRRPATSAVRLHRASPLTRKAVPLVQTHLRPPPPSRTPHPHSKLRSAPLPSGRRRGV